MDISEGLKRKLRIANNVVALTGAGVSQESGIPTFRQAQTGLWEKYDPQQLATPQAFQRNPQLVWAWYQWRRSLIAEAAPNEGHMALAALEKRIAGFTLITQNVDGFHQQAGSSRVIELHGNIRRNKCFECGAQDGGNYSGATEPPRCAHCDGLLRPDVVWFGEQLPASAIVAGLDAAEKAEIFLAIGTSGLVYPAASLPQIAKQNGALLIEINPGETALTRLADHVFNGPAGEVLPQLLDRIWMEED